jgi:ABC transport system ATP-binding/permease protein
MPPPLLLLQEISLTFGTTPLLSGAGLAVATGDRICLVGRNGSGKSTLLRVAAGLLQSDGGERFAQPGARISYLPQEPDVTGFATTLGYVEAGFSADATDRHRALYLLKELGLSGGEEPAALSGGEARRIALARALAPQPDILLLDEPTNHLDLPGIEWLERELAGMRSSIVLVSHDRRLLEQLSRTTVWLDRGVTRTLDQGFAAFEPWRDSFLEQEATEQHKLSRKIAMEEDWLRYESPPGAHATSGGFPNCIRYAENERSTIACRAQCALKRPKPISRAGWSRSRRASRNPMRAERSCGISQRGLCVAIESASSVRTAPGKRPC